MRQFFLILVIPLLLCSTIDANARVSSQSTITVHQTNHTLNIIYGTGTADNAPDLCVPSLCYMSAYLHAFRLHIPTNSSLLYIRRNLSTRIMAATINIPLIIAMVGSRLRLSSIHMMATTQEY
jgi:hypothetical protein